MISGSCSQHLTPSTQKPDTLPRADSSSFRSSAIGRRSSNPSRKPSAVPCHPPVAPVGEPHASRNAERKGRQGGAREPGQGLADSGGAREDLPPLVEQVELVKTPRARYAREACLEARLLKSDQFEPPRPITPVDPPGEAPSETSVAVIDDYRCSVLQAFSPTGRPQCLRRQPITAIPRKRNSRGNRT